MKKLFAILILSVFLISFASALDFDNVLNYEEDTETITIENTFGLGRDLIKAQLTDNFCEEGRWCEADKKIELFEEGVLIEDFKTLRIDDGSWDEQNIRWYKLEYFGMVEDFETQCIYENITSENGTYENQICEQVKTGEHKDWIQFKEKDIFPKGIYEVRTMGEIKPGRVYDWQIKIEGKWTTPWATWGNISLGDDAEVILNSPTDNSTTYFNPVTFNASANITGGATLTNLSLWTNQSGSWENKETKTIIAPITHSSDANQISSLNQVSMSGSSYVLVKTISNINGKVLNGTDEFWKESTDYRGLYVRWRFNYNDSTYSDVIEYRASIQEQHQYGTYINPNPNKIVSNIEISMHVSTAGYTMYEKNTYVFGESNVDIFNQTILATTLWNVQSCDSDGDCGFAPSNFTVSPDSTAPNITLSYPTGLIDYKKYGNSLDLNWTVVDDGILDTCWYNYNNTNTTVTCGDNHTAFNLNTDKTLTFYANDSLNNLASEVVSWDYKVFENSRTLNTSSYETKSETFAINVTANSSLTAVTLNYNGTEYSTTKSGDVYSKTLDIPVGVQNRSVRWKFTYAGDTIYSDYSYQNISEAVFTLCNASYTDDFLNISFKDEADLSSINASIPTSSWVYYLGSGTVSKSYTYENTSVNYNYNFCATPDLTFNVDSYIQYKQGTDYPQRIYDPDVLTYNSTVTNKILYLLSSVDGIYVTFQIINSAEQGISNVEVSGTRVISGETVEVANGLTDAAGSVTFWLNPDFQHEFIFTKTGYETTTYTVTPTQPAYTIILGGGIPVETDCTRGVSYQIIPSSNFLDQNTNYNFSFTIDSSYWALTLFNISLYYGNDTLIDSDSSTTQEGGTLTFNSINTTNQTEMYLRYAYEVNNSICLSTSTNWIVQSIDGRDYSLWYLFTQSSEYLDANLYGVKGESGNSDFGRIVIVFLIIVLVSGVSMQKYGIQSEPAIMSIIFAVVAMLDFGLNFIPTIQVGDFIAIPHFVTVVTFIMWLAFLWRER